MEKNEATKELIDEVTRLKTLLGPMNLKYVAKEIGLPYQNLTNFVAGRTQIPSYTTIIKIQTYFKKRGEL